MVSAVPSDGEQELEQLGWEFEGLPVVQSRIDAASPGEFPALDEDSHPLMVSEGDIIVVQVEYLIGYKGGIQVKARKRIHHAKTIDGSQQVVGVQRRT